MNERYMSFDKQSMITETLNPCNLNMYVSSIIGTRKYQQDSYGCIKLDGGALAVVCDGMGGLNGGEQASSSSVELLMNDFVINMPSVKEAKGFFCREAEKLDKMVYSLKDSKGNKLGAGTTIVSVIIHENLMNWLSVGDSKIYLIRNGMIYCLVVEHNYRLTLDRLIKSGKITAEQYKKEEHRAEALISFLGMGNVSLMDLNETPFVLKPRDIILLCSDGLYKTLTEAQILSIVLDNSFNYQQAANVLTHSALKYSKGVQDNTTVALLSYE